MMSDGVQAKFGAMSVLLGGWRPAEGHFDELCDPGGALRPQWEVLSRHLEALGEVELNARWEEGRAILRDHGVTYNAADPTGAAERPWELDPLPFLIAGEEWARIELGVIQRAKLLNRVLNDVYVGPQLLLRDGFIPPGLVLPNPNFLRACRGVRLPGDVYLHLCAFDLARTPDGQWRVLSNRTQAPSGLGYALENRTVVGRLLPQEFQACGVRRLGGFFARFRQSLVDLAPSPTAWPRMVFLTPGVHSEAYYEHALLSRFLGVTLVEAADLTVRERRVFLKTLEGLQRVEVIVRRVSDVQCDPLELAGESTVGVPGLVEAVRAGNVLVANGLGAGLTESSALIPQLPGLCRHLLGEDLMLPSVDTYWCGEACDLNRVMDRLPSMVIKDAAAECGFKSMSGGELDEQARRRLADRISERPHGFVGQPKVALSQAPAWTGQGVTGMPLVLRVYVASCRGGYEVLPGGLSKVSGSLTDVVSGLQFGGSSKDTWVLGSADATADSGRAISIESRPAMRISAGVPSRLADNLFWLGRYSERLEYVTRLSRCALARVVDTDSQRSRDERRALCPLVSELQAASGGIVDDLDEESLGEAVLRMLYDPEHAGGVTDLLLRLRGIISLVRDRFSGDALRVFNRLSLHPGQRAERLPFTVARTLAGDMLVDLAALSGIEMENMTRGVDWRFLDFGRRLERADRMTRLVQTGLDVARDELAVLNPLLEIADSGMTYRRRYFAEPEVGSLLELLVLETENPRSVAFQIAVMREHVSRFPMISAAETELSEKRWLEEIEVELRSRSVKRLAKQGDEVFSGIVDRLASISKRLTHRYINLTPPELFER